MKKLSFLLGAVALLATSCSNDEVLEVTQPKGISFDTFVNNSTRALVGNDMNLENLQKPIAEPEEGRVVSGGGFDVWAVSWSPSTKANPTSVFVGQNVEWGSTAAGADDWTYSPEKYWVIGDNYRFSAIAPAFKNKTFDTVQKTMKESNGVIEVQQNLGELPDNIANIEGGLIITFDNELAKANIDLCHAFDKISNVQADNIRKVKLNFEHMLSRVKFTFKNAFDAQMTCLKITNLRITDPQAKATINKIDNEIVWTPVDKAVDPIEPKVPFMISFAMQKRTDDLLGDYMVGGTSTTQAGSLPRNTQESDHHYIFPLKLNAGETGKVYNVSFTVEWWNVDISNGNAPALQNSYPHTIALPATNYQPGYSYNFIAEINENNINPEGVLLPIQFNASVEEWKEFGEGNTDIPVTVPVGGTTAGGGSSETPDPANP